MQVISCVHDFARHDLLAQHPEQLRRLRGLAARRRRPLRPRIRAGAGARGPGVLAAGPGQLLGAGPGFFHLGHRRRAFATGAGDWAPGWRMPATSFSASRCGGVLPRPCAPGWRRWRAGCAASACRQPDAGRFSRTRMAFWIALAVLLCASTALEWSRLYRFEARLPDHAGGALGYLIGSLGVKWLGFTGSGLVFVALVVLGAAVVFRFSWSHVAERLGARIDGFIESRREKREIAQDLALGQQAARAARGSPARRAHRDRGAPSHAGPHRAEPGRGAQERASRQGTAKAAVHGTARLQAAAGGPARWRTDAAGDGGAGNAGNDQPA